VTGDGVPAPSLDASDDTTPRPYSITAALDCAYYQRDHDALMRIGRQVESEMARLRDKLARLTDSPKEQP
jgi:hypothetical protein